MRQIHSRLPLDELSKLPSFHIFQFFATSGAEFAQNIDSPTIRHVAQLDEGLVRLQIGIQNFAGKLSALCTTGLEDRTRILPIFA